MPFLRPPPASTTVKTLGQWSRPPVPLIFGVRPNSEEIMMRVESSSPLRSRSRTSVADFGRFGVDIDRLAGLGRADEVIGPLIEGIHRLDRIGLFGRGKMGIHRF